MRVLITRTAEDGAATARALEALGHEAVIAPLRERMPLDTSLPEGPFEAVIATSRHAFSGHAFSGHAFSGHAFSGHAFSGLPAELSALPCFCVGEKTAQAARTTGFATVEALGGDGAALAAKLLTRFKPGAHLLYLAGQPRHRALETALKAGGIEVGLSERYAMRPVPTLPDPARTALAAGMIDAVLHYSSESARAYLELAAQAQLDSAALAPLQLCLSEAVAAILEAKVPPNRLRIAGQPNEAALFAQLAP